MLHDATPILYDATQELHDATQVLHYATEVLHHGTQVLSYATQVLHDTTDALHLNFSSIVATSFHLNSFLLGISKMLNNKLRFQLCHSLIEFALV